MTKSRARQRAKAKAAAKGKKREAGPKAETPEQKPRPGQFDRGPGTISSARGNANTKTFSGSRRGAARSR